jgi:hypothetical protein
MELIPFSALTMRRVRNVEAGKSAGKTESSSERQGIR